MTPADLYASVPGQTAAIEALVAAAQNPVHAYLFVGPRGAGKERAAKAFAATLLCPDGGCGTCAHCFRILGRGHPDLVVATLAGTDYRVDDIRDLNLAVQRRPLEASRIVAIIPEAQRLVGAAPALLKTLEEPPPTTIFILLADDLPQGMATIRSRCGEVPFAALSDSAVAQWLVGQGIDSTVAAVAAEGAAGDTERALLLTEDEGFAARLERWREIPSLLDGSGVTAVGLAVELQQSLTDACAPLVEAQARELRELEEEAAAMGERGLPGRKDLLDHHKRQIRRYERTELRAGLGVLARVYRDRMVAATARDDASEIRRCASAIDAISAMTMSLKRNPRPLLNLEHLLLALPS